jgi:hypothetical protein
LTTSSVGLWVSLVFHHCGKIPERNNLKGGKICFSSQFQMFQSVVVQLHCCGLVLRQNIMVERVWWSKTTYL